MNASENAFNALYPTVLRLAALQRRIIQAAKNLNVPLMEELGVELHDQLNNLIMIVDGIEAGQIDDSLTTSIAGVLNQMKHRSRHN